MQTVLISLENPQWANAEHTAINCNIKTSQFGDMQIPFTASKNDVEVHGREIFQSLVNGKYGPIGNYIAPPEPEQLVLKDQQSL